MTSITVRLASLREPAPASILPGVLDRSGLARH